MTRSLCLLALALSLSGCYTTKVVNAGLQPARGETHHAWQQTFLWGMISPGSVNVAGYCGDKGVAEVKTQVGGIGLIANWFTAGLWVPMSVKVTCGQ